MRRFVLPALGLMLLPTCGWTDESAAPWYARVGQRLEEAVSHTIIQPLGSLSATIAPDATIISDRSTCGAATDDCAPAATSACQRKGYRSGKPLSLVSYRVCSGYLSDQRACQVKRRLDQVACWS